MATESTDKIIYNVITAEAGIRKFLLQSSPAKGGIRKKQKGNRMKRILFSIAFISLVRACFAGENVLDENAQLFQAARDGNMQAVQTALANGADVNVVKITDGVTALMMASQNGHTEVVKLLLEEGADVNAKRTSDGVSALLAASRKGHTDIVRLLLDKGADVNVKRTTDGVTALWIASQ